MLLARLTACVLSFEIKLERFMELFKTLYISFFQDFERRRLFYPGHLTLFFAFEKKDFFPCPLSLNTLDVPRKMRPLNYDSIKILEAPPPNQHR